MCRDVAPADPWCRDGRAEIALSETDTHVSPRTSQSTNGLLGDQAAWSDRAAAAGRGFACVADLSWQRMPLVVAPASVCKLLALERELDAPGSARLTTNNPRTARQRASALFRLALEPRDGRARGARDRSCLRCVASRRSRRASLWGTRIGRTRCRCPRAVGVRTARIVSRRDLTSNRRHCWYLATPNTSCKNACLSRGGFNARSLAMSALQGVVKRASRSRAAV